MRNTKGPVIILFDYSFSPIWLLLKGYHRFIKSVIFSYVPLGRYNLV